MFYVLLVLSVLTVVIRLGATIGVAVVEGKAAFLRAQPHGSCSLIGPIVPKDAIRGCAVHEWVHMLTLAPYWGLAMNFSWILFYPHGWLAAILLGTVVNIVALIALEGVADLGAMCAVGPRVYMRGLIRVYTDLGVTRWGIVATLISYPVWRLYPMLVVLKHESITTEGGV